MFAPHAPTPADRLLDHVKQIQRCNAQIAAADAPALAETPLAQATRLYLGYAAALMMQIDAGLPGMMIAQALASDPCASPGLRAAIQRTLDCATARMSSLEARLTA